MEQSKVTIMMKKWNADSPDIPDQGNQVNLRPIHSHV